MLVVRPGSPQTPRAEGGQIKGNTRGDSVPYASAAWIACSQNTLHPKKNFLLG